MAKAQSNDKQTFRGTVQELAGKMALNGQVLNLQDVQFLTRIGSGSFAKKIGTAPGTGTRGGKRATIWEITPSAKLAFDAHEAAPEVQGKQASNAKGKQASAGAVDPSLLESAVKKAVAEVLNQSGQSAPAPRRKRRTKAEIEADKAAQSKAA